MTGSSVQVDPHLVESIAANAERIRSRIAELTDREVRLVCVTKGHPVGVAAAAVAAGMTDLGENYAQELAGKAAALNGGLVLSEGLVPGDGLALGEDTESGGVTDIGGGTEISIDGQPHRFNWHFIGQLQTNKIKLIARYVSCWHTVDRPSVISELVRRAPGAKICIQMDLAGLAGRGGCEPGEAAALVATAREAGLDVVGLMGVAPPGGAELARPGFRQLVAMADDLGVPERSIGMSGDYEVAVEEGATMIRVGSGLVGARPPRPVSNN